MYAARCFGHTMRIPHKIRKCLSVLSKIALVLAIVGGLNWGSIGIFGFDFVAAVFGGQGTLGSRIIFILVGIAALWCISLLFRERTPVESHE